MKFFLLVFLFFSLATTITAQETKPNNKKSPVSQGVYSLYGSISYSFTNVETGDNISRFQFFPGCQYFIFDNIAIGGAVLYTKVTQGDFSLDALGVGPTIRYYLPIPVLKTFLAFQYAYTYAKQDNIASSQITNNNEYSLGLGFDYFLSKNVALEPLFRYTYSDIDIGNNSQEFFFGVGINAFIF